MDLFYSSYADPRQREIESGMMLADFECNEHLKINCPECLKPSAAQMLADLRKARERLTKRPRRALSKLVDKAERTKAA